MWNYVRIKSENSPMAEILSQCTDKSNLRLVIYHLSENHVECATVGHDEVRAFGLGNAVNLIKNDARNGNHAVLAYDLGDNSVYLIDSTPELQIASAVLLCVVTELLNGRVQPRVNECGRPSVRRSAPIYEDEPSPTPMDSVVRRDERGRFVRKTENCDEPWKTPPTCDDMGAMSHRFRLGHR